MAFGTYDLSNVDKTILNLINSDPDNLLGLLPGLKLEKLVKIGLVLSIFNQHPEKLATIAQKIENAELNDKSTEKKFKLSSRKISLLVSELILAASNKGLPADTVVPLLLAYVKEKQLTPLSANVSPAYKKKIEADYWDSLYNKKFPPKE